MGIFLKAQRKARKLTPQKINRDLFQFIRTLEKKLEALNRKQIEENSKDVNGNDLGFYSKSTEIITTNNVLLGRKGKIKREGDPFDLNDTGSFLDNLFAEVEGESIFFGTTDSKKKEVLKNLLSKDIFGLSDANLRQVIAQDILPFLSNYLHKHLI
jgi:hypothetical protein